VVSPEFSSASINTFSGTLDETRQVDHSFAIGRIDVIKRFYVLNDVRY